MQHTASLICGLGRTQRGADIISSYGQLHLHMDTPHIAETVRGSGWVLKKMKTAVSQLTGLSFHPGDCHLGSSPTCERALRLVQHIPRSLIQLPLLFSHAHSGRTAVRTSRGRSNTVWIDWSPLATRSEHGQRRQQCFHRRRRVHGLKV